MRNPEPRHRPKPLPPWKNCIGWKEAGPAAVGCGWGRANGTVLQVEGLGRDAATNEIIHQAFGVISWDAVNKTYLFRAWRAHGVHVDAQTKLHEDGSFEWGFAIPNVGFTRYVIRNEDGDWVETGTMEMPNGQTYPFIEFRLKKAMD